MPADVIIEVRNVYKKFSDSPFSGVKSASFSINHGSIVAIVGESGSGKSTLLKLIYGLISAEEGTVLFKNEEVRGPEKKLIPGHDSMKMVTQDFSLNIYAKVYDNIASMLSNTNLRFKADKTEEMLRLLRIDHLANKRVVDLSGGEQQRVAIAKAIITEPEVLLMDEPFSQVDTLLKSQLRADIRRLSESLGITIIIVSHDPADGLSLADELIVLRKGEVVETGSPRDLYNHPENLYTAQLLSDCNVLSKDEALKIGIETEFNTIAVYPQAVSVQRSGNELDFLLVDSFYKGFAEELLLERNGVRLKGMNFQIGKYCKGEVVPVSIERFLEF